jgi:proteasome lid subunit RPN8/RPN11
MRNAVMLLLLVVNAGRASATTSDRTVALAWELLADARYGSDPKEHAAFIVADASGELRLARWPWAAETKRATYRGNMPRGAVAIVHTHPNHLPTPSPNDVAVARKLGMPVYVITRTSVMRTDGSGSAYVAQGDWNPDRERARP